MKKTLIFAGITLMLFACKQTTTYTITGTVAQTELEGKQVFLSVMAETGQQQIGSTEIRNGKYVFKGSAGQPVHATISIVAGEQTAATSVRPISFILENGKTTITTNEEQENRIGGSANNDRLQTLADAQRATMQKMKKIGEEFPNASDEQRLELLARNRECNNELFVITSDFVKNNINNLAGQSQLYIVNALTVSISIDPLGYLKGIVSAANAETLQIPEVMNLIERVEQLKLTAIGNTSLDFRAFTLDGKEVTFFDYVGKGKFVLIDFWASWCGACIVEKPLLSAAHKKYKDKGFEIVSVSIDDDRDAWVKAVKDNNLSEWPQISDLEGQRSELIKLYSIFAVPTRLLIDREGKIVAKNLRNNLDSELAKWLP